MDLKSWQVLTTVFAALFGVATSAIGYFFELRRDDGSGRKKQTFWGWIFVALMASTAFNTFAAIAIRTRVENRSATAAANDEAARLQNERAQMALRQLRIEWKFTGVPDSFWMQSESRGQPIQCPSVTDKLHDGYGDKRNYFYPFLASLATGSRWDTGPAILLIALDDNASEVLPLGMVDVGIKRAKVQQDQDPLAWNDTDPDRLKTVAATIEFRQHLEQCDSDARKIFALVPPRQRSCELITTIKRDGEQVTMHWDLDETCIEKGLNRPYSSLPPISRMPKRLRMLLMTHIDDLPADPEDFSAWGSILPWEPRTGLGMAFPDRSHVRLIPNNSDQDAKEFEVRFHPGGTFSGKGGGAEFQNAYPLITTFVSSP